MAVVIEVVDGWQEGRVFGWGEGHLVFQRNVINNQFIIRQTRVELIEPILLSFLEKSVGARGWPCLPIVEVIFELHIIRLVLFFVLPIRIINPIESAHNVPLGGSIALDALQFGTLLGAFDPLDFEAEVFKELPVSICPGLDTLDVLYDLLLALTI